MTARPKVRCAIYTRKSSDDGLDQEFNSLDAQYEACSAYIASQRHEGWKALPDRYDDGGLSGGTLERVLPDEFERVSARTVTLSLSWRRDHATRRERRRGWP